MTGRTVGMLAISAMLCHAPPPGSFLTAPQQDPRADPFTPSSVDVSANGRYVAFESMAQLVPADVNTRRDIYLLDLETKRVTLESSPQGVWIDAGRPRLSDDGRYLVFEATVAIADGAAYRTQIVLCDRTSGTHRLVTTAPGGEAANGSSRSPDISDDGRVVVFASTATNLVAGTDTNGSAEDIYAFDARASTIQRVSVDSAGVQSSIGASITPSISGDGRWVAFASTSALDGSLVRGNSPARRESRQVFVRDLVGRVTTRVSAGTRGEMPDRDSWGPAVNRDGRFVAFVSEATNLGRGGRNRTADIFLRDATTGTTTLVSRTPGDEDASGTSVNPAISADGRFVAFQSDASNLVCDKRCQPDVEDLNLLWDVFVFDRETTTIARVSGDESGEWMEASRGPGLDGSGHVLAFASRHPTDALDRGDDYDLFVSVPPS